MMKCSTLKIHVALRELYSVSLIKSFLSSRSSRATPCAIRRLPDPQSCTLPSCFCFSSWTPSVIFQTQADSILSVCCLPPPWNAGSRKARVLCVLLSAVSPAPG